MERKPIVFLTLVVTLIMVSNSLGQQCSSNQFSIKNNGEEYLTISSPTEVKTCGGINICEDLKNGKQSLSLNNNNGELSISNGNSVTIPDISPENEIQKMSINEGTITLSLDGGSVELPDSSSTNEIQALLIQNNTLSLSHGGGVADLSFIRTKFSGFSVSLPLGTSKSAGDISTLIYSVLEFNTFVANSFNLQTGAFMVPITGYYRFSLRGWIATGTPSADSRIAFYYYINGGFRGHCGMQLSVGDSPLPSCSYIAKLNVDDTVQVRMYAPIVLVLGGAGGGPMEWQGEFLGT